MTMSSSYKTRLDAEKTLLDSLSDYRIELGVVQKNTNRKETVSLGLTNAELMFIHENGSPMRNVPSRPVLELTIKWALDGIVEETVERCIDGILTGWNKSDLEKELKILCHRIETHARRIIYDNDGTLAPNKPATAARKKGNHPLFDTGQLARSITCILTKNDSGEL